MIMCSKWTDDGTASRFSWCCVAVAAKTNVTGWHTDSKNVSDPALQFSSFGRRDSAAKRPPSGSGAEPRVCAGSPPGRTGRTGDASSRRALFANSGVLAQPHGLESTH